MGPEPTYAGVDVGGRRKGFHAAVVDQRGVVAGPRRFGGVDELVGWLRNARPDVVALDSPMTCAPAGERSRAGERELAREICGIRWTPEEARLNGDPYYEWIVHGRELYGALKMPRQRLDWKIIEVFPTASWTVWAGPRGKRRRAYWTRTALADMKLDGLPPRRLNQDDRDSIAAALTARLFAQGRAVTFGDIVVPADTDL